MGRRTLVAVSAAQLAAGLAGLAVAVRRRRHYDLPLMHGSPEHVPRDSVLMGTAYSAPVPMLAGQLWSTVRLARGDDRAARNLGVLGGLMVPGYLAERFDRQHLRHWDPVETPVVLAGAGLAAAMVWAARGSLRGPRGMPGA
jgi:hypothetical protein